jgi:hypothetical protein
MERRKKTLNLRLKPICILFFQSLIVLFLVKQQSCLLTRIKGFKKFFSFKNLLFFEK